MPGTVVTPHVATRGFQLQHQSVPHDRPREVAACTQQDTPAGCHLDSSTITSTLMGRLSSEQDRPGCNDGGASVSSRNQSVGENVTIVPPNLLPERRKLIDHDWARKMWQYAHHLSNVLPVVDPEEADFDSYCVILRKIFDYA